MTVMTLGIGYYAAGAAAETINTNFYPSYTTYYVDGTSGSDSNNGTSLALAKQTIQAGVNLLTAGGSRLIVMPGTYTLAADLTMPAGTGVGSSARRVIMKNPGSAMPLINLNSTFTVRPNKTQAADWLVLSGLEIYGFSGSSFIGGIFANSSASMDNFLFQYLNIHDIEGTIQDITPGIYLDGVGHNGIIRQCKIHDVRRQTTGFLAHDNLAGVLSYDARGVEVEHCLFYNSYSGVRLKRASGTHPNGWNIHHNIFHDHNNGILYTVGGTGDPYHDNDIGRYNLFYTTADAAINAQVNSTTGQNTMFTFDHNTFGQDCVEGIVMSGVTALTVDSNALACSSTEFSFDNRGSLTNSATLFNRNGYYTGAGQNWRMNRFGTGAAVFSSLATWKTSFSVGGRTAELATDPDANAVSASTLAALFTNTSTRDYSPASGSVLIGAGSSGTNIGYTSTDCGPNW